MDCPNDKCKETFLSNDIPIMNMVKFKSENDKEEFQKIYQQTNAINNPKGMYYGGMIAAPVAKEIFENILPYGILKSNEMED